MVTAKKIRERLVAVFPKAKNLSRARMNAIADALAKIPADDADDAAIDEVIEAQNDILSFEEIARQDDRLRTLEAKAAKSDEDKDDDKTDDATDKDDDKTDQTPEWAKGMFAKLEAVTTELGALKAGHAKETKQQQAESLFKKSEILNKLPERVQNRYLRTLDLDSADVSLEDQIAEMEEENEDFIQTLTDSKDYAGAAPIKTSASKVSDEELAGIVDNL